MSRVLQVSKAAAGRRQFASDNYAGVCPEASAAMTKANHGHVRGYGDDEWTALASDLIREVFETKCQVFFVFNGKGRQLARARLDVPIVPGDGGEQQPPEFKQLL